MWQMKGVMLMCKYILHYIIEYFMHLHWVCIELSSASEDDTCFHLAITANIATLDDTQIYSTSTLRSGDMRSLAAVLDLSY